MLVGGIINFFIEHNSELDLFVSFINKEELFYKVDVNKASIEELVNVPFIGEFTAKRIIAYRQANNGIKDLSEIKSINGIPGKNFDKFCKYLYIKR